MKFWYSSPGRNKQTFHQKRKERKLDFIVDKGLCTKRRKSPKVLKVEYYKNVKCYTKYDLLHNIGN